MNILTFDIEEWFHLLETSATACEEQWSSFEVRIYDNMERIFRILDETDTRATFFVIGWIARRYPDIVKRIADRYDIGSHTMDHQLVWQQSRENFARDLDYSVKFLEDLTGKKVKYFRAPGFSIRESEGWAFEVMHDLGIEIDSSIFPAHHAHGGFPSYGDAKPTLIEVNGKRIKEFPISCREALGHHLIYQGGGYFRLFPYPLIKRWAREQEYLLSYIHPRDLDAGQPVIPGLPLSRRFKSYVGLHGAEKKLRRMLTDFRFTDIATADRAIDWDSAKIIKI